MRRAMERTLPGLAALVIAWTALPTFSAGQDLLETEVPAEMSPAAERFKALTDPKGELKKQQEKLQKPPFEFFRTQIAPSEVIPFLKEHHWVSVSLEMQANHADYAGVLHTAPIRLQGMPHRIVYRRDVALLAERSARLSLQMLIPTLPRERNELDLELIRPDAIRGDGVTQAILQRLLPHQMLIPILGKEGMTYVNWSRYQAVLPASVQPDPNSTERLRYYRLVVPQDPEKTLPLSPHPLTWTSISHLIWDDQNPDEIDVGQQQAMLDWIHWGGQLIVVGGAGPSLAPLQDSFLGPVLPATPSGRNVSLGSEAFAAMSAEFPQPYWPIEGETGAIRRYIEGAAPIRATEDRPIFVSGLTPKDGASVISLGDPDNTPVAVEWRVGRGRVMILAVKPNDPALQVWPGHDTWVRRVILRRPVESRGGRNFLILPGSAVSWLRYAARDIGASDPRGPRVEDDSLLPGEAPPPTTPVAAWLDSSSLPVESRKALEKAAGITIPGSDFVFKVIAAYMMLLVPINWLVCRFVLRRQEWAWVATPLLAIGFAVAVERAAAYDLGFDTACDEIDLLEFQPGYSRAHVSRFAALYSTGRGSYEIAYPDAPSAVALPMSLGGDRYQRGEDQAQSEFQTSPEAALQAFPVQPRSLAMFRSEAMETRPGGIELVREGPGEMLTIVNRSGLELRDATVIDASGQMRYPLGTIGPDATVPLGDGEVVKTRGDAPPDDDDATSQPVDVDTTGAQLDWIDVDRFLERLQAYSFDRPEDRGEWRLVAWTPDPHPGQEIRPAVDRHRGVRLIVAHLDYGGVPKHDAPEMTGVVRDQMASTSAAPIETDDASTPR